MSDYGIKIAEEEKNVKTAGLNELIFHSSYPLLKVKSSGSGTLTGIGVGVNNFTIYTHNLGYTPMFAFFIQWYDSSSGIKQSTYKQTTICDLVAGGYNNLYTAYTDTTKLSLTLDLVVTDGTNLNYQYYLFYDAIP